MIKEEAQDTFFPTRIELINRNNEKRMIGEAIHGEKRTVLFFIAEGGIGKTRLLEEVLEQRGSLAQMGIQCTDLIDLFHSEFHSPDNVQNHIADQIDPLNRFFQLYREARRKFLEEEGQGVQRKALTELGRRRDQQFLDDYSALTKIGQVRPLLLIDTTEQIQHESEVLQSLCNVQVENLATYSWLINTAPLLPNTIILLAGRPRLDFEKQLKESFEQHGWNFQPKDLSVLSSDDAMVYINSLSRGRPALLALSEDKKRWIVDLAEGKPILLALVLQFIHYEGLVRLQEKIARGEARDKVLIEHLIHMPGEYGDAMQYMLLARNGMDANLLAHLTGWQKEKIMGFFGEMKTNVLFKSRGKTLFLHDELYELHDRYYLDDDHTRRDYGRIASYYRDLLKQPHPYKEVLELRLQSLFYELREHTEQGYNLFSVWDEEAIWLHFPSNDLRMRDDLLKFVSRYMRAGAKFFDLGIADQVPVEIIDSDNAIRCIERALAEEKYRQALDLAETIQNSEEPIFMDRMKKDRLFKARVYYGMAEAALYLGGSGQVVTLLNKVIELLEGWEQTNPEETFWKQRTLGRAYNRFGYYRRINGFYAKAIPLYRKAVTEFRKGQMPYLLAQTLTNLAYILALTGDTETALEHVNDAIKIWERYGMGYRRALTLITKALILVQMNKPIAALSELKEVEKITKQLDESRVEILLRIGKGRALRNRGNLWKEELAQYPIEEAEGYLEEGREVLEQAEEMVKAAGRADALAEWEIYNELGSLYCDWAWLNRSRGKSTIASTYYRNSIRYQEQALKIARDKEMPFQIADSLDDIAQVYGDKAFFLYEEKLKEEGDESLERAEAALKEAESKVPIGYFTGAAPAADDREESAPFWLVLGKANLWRGIWEFRKLESEKGLSFEANEPRLTKATNFLLASLVCFKRYGENTISIERSMRYLSKYAKDANVPIEWMEKQIAAAEAKYSTDLCSVRIRMQNKLGF